MTGRVTIVDVAREAGVSRAAVSKVIRNATGVSPAMRTRVTAAIERLDYRPSTVARAMRGSSYTLGFEMPHLGNPFLMEIVEGAREVICGTPYRLIIAPADGREYGAINALAGQRVDGIVAVSPLVDQTWLEGVAQRIPVVMLGRHDHSSEYDNVVGDDIQGARDAMTHLIGLGHRRIAHITEDDVVTIPGSGTPHALRLQSYLDGMREAGLGSHVLVAHTDRGMRGARDVTAAMLRGQPCPTAIFAAHDSLAIGAMAALTDQGGPRTKVAVVGYDNSALAEHPLISLTSVDQSGKEMGAQAINMLLERIEGRTVPRRCIITPLLYVRNSSFPLSPGKE